MNAITKIIAGTAVGAGLIGAFTYVRGLTRAQAELQIVPSIYLHKVSLEGLIIRVDALLKNPTRANFKIKYPLIEIMHAEKLVGSSQMVDKDIHIPSFGQVMIQDMMVTIPVLNLFSVASDLMLSINNHEPVVLNVGVITTLDLGWTQTAYVHRQDITLKH
ncbi:MAG: hypothetical protein ACHQD8_01385 [Chitinophagales bacterium]